MLLPLNESRSYGKNLAYKRGPSQPRVLTPCCRGTFCFSTKWHLNNRQEHRLPMNTYGTVLVPLQRLVSQSVSQPASKACHSHHDLTMDWRFPRRSFDFPTRVLLAHRRGSQPANVSETNVPDRGSQQGLTTATPSHVSAVGQILGCGAHHPVAAMHPWK